MSARNRGTAADLPIRVCIVTMDTHMASATERARPRLERDFPGLVLNLHAAAEYAGDDHAIARVRADIARADVEDDAAASL